MKLKKSIGLVTGTTYSITITVGAGILALPGLAYQVAGEASVYAWIFDLALVVPLLTVFSWLVARAPSAGGIADFVKLAFGRSHWLRFTQLLLIVTLFVGTAAIAKVGAHYLNEGALCGLSLIVIPMVINTFGIRISSKVQILWTLALIGFLVFAVVASIPHWRNQDWIPLQGDRSKDIWTAMGLIWFAFSGVEMTCFLAEEYRSTRQFVTAVALSLVAVGALYVCIAFALSKVATPDDSFAIASPIIALVRISQGEVSAWFSGWFGYFLILTNLNGAILAASRSVFSMSREGAFFPPKFQKLNRFDSPATALWFYCAGTGAIYLVIEYFHISIAQVFTFESQNWFLLYVLAIAAFIRLQTTHTMRALGLVALLFSFTFAAVYSWMLTIPAILFGIAALPPKT